MGIETYTTPGYDVDATIALKIRPSEKEDLELDLEPEEKSYAFYRIMAIVMAVLPFWLLLFLPFKALTYKYEILKVSECNAFALLKSFFSKNFAGNHIFDTLPVLPPNSITLSVTNGLFFYLMMISIPVCFIISLVAAIFKKTSPALLRTILCIEFFVYAGYMLSLMLACNFHGLKNAEPMVLPCLIMIAISLVMYIVLSAVKSGVRSLLGLLIFLLTFVSAGAVLYSLFSNKEAITALFEGKKLYKTLTIAVAAVYGVSIILALGGISAKRLCRADVVRSAIMLYLGVRVVFFTLFEKSFSDSTLFAIISTAAALVMLLIELLVLRRRKKKSIANTSLLVSSELKRRDAARERDKALALREKKAKKDMKAMQRKAKKEEKALKRKAKKAAKAQKKQEKAAQKPKKELSEKALKKQEAKAAKAAEKSGKKAAKAKKVKTPKSETFFYRIVIAILAVLPILAFLILKTKVFTDGYEAKEMGFFKAFGELFAADFTGNKFLGFLPVFAPSDAFLAMIPGVLFYLIPISMVACLTIAIISIIKPKRILKAIKSILIIEFCVCGLFAISTACISLFGSVDAALDLPSLIVAVIAFIAYLVFTVMKNGKSTFLGLVLFLLAFVAAGAVVLAIAANTESIRDIYLTNDLVKIATLAVVAFYAIAATLAFLAIAGKKLRRGDVVLCWIMIYLGVRIIMMSFLCDAYKDFLILGVVATVASVIMLIIESIVLKRKKNAELMEKYADYVSAAPVQVSTETAIVVAANPVEDTDVISTQVSNPFELNIEPSVEPVAASTTAQGIDVYGIAFDPFIGTLTLDERKEFVYLFMAKPYPGIPEYQVGGDNRTFFRKVFINLGTLRDQLSNSLLEKIYQYTIKL